MKRKLLTLLLAVLIVAGLSSCGSKGDSSAGSDAEPEGTAVEVQTVGTGDIATENTVTGSVTANRSVPVLSKVACKVKSVAVKSGDTVKVGDTLFTLDTADIQSTYGSALDTYHSSNALLDEQISQLKKTLNNLQALYQMGAASQSAVDQARLGLMQAENTRKNTLTQMGLTDVLDALDAPEVTAPISGTISNVGVTAGVAVVPNTPAVIVSEIGHPQVVVNVSETLQPSISIGSSVDVEIPSLGEHGTVIGKVASVASAVSPNTALFEIHIDLPEDLDVSIGMFARVTFHTDARFGTVLIPTEAILTEDDGKKSVYIVDGNAAYHVEITTGLVGEAQTEVTSGLHGGEQLVTRGQSYLSDGAPIRITEG